MGVPGTDSVAGTTTPEEVFAKSGQRARRPRQEYLMTLEEALKFIQQTRSFIGKIYSDEVV